MDTPGVTLNELRFFPKQVSDVEARLKETRAAAIGTVSSLLEEALQIKLPTISSQFVTKLVDVLTQTSLKAILPKNHSAAPTQCMGMYIGQLVGLGFADGLRKVEGVKCGARRGAGGNSGINFRGKLSDLYDSFQVRLGLYQN